MPVVKANEPLGKRPVIILIYGEPGIGKTSLFNTADKPLLIDFDRGVDRSILRKDTLVVNTWEDIQNEEKAGTFAGYSTIGIDTAKAALDDFLMGYVCQKDPKNLKNKLAMYGSIGEEFKLFISNRRSENADIVLIAHAKDDKEGDTVTKYPDVTGGSYNLLLRIADQVGYMKTVNNKRTIQFEPSDTMKGKNVARIPIEEVPNETEPTFKNFMSRLINKVKDAINTQNEEQRAAIVKSEGYQEQLAKVDAPDQLTALLKQANDLPDYLKLPLRKLISEKAKEKLWVADKESGSFKPAVAEVNGSTNGQHTEEPGANIAPTTLDDRSKMLTGAGAILSSEDFTYDDGKVMTYDDLMKMGENEFNQFIATLVPKDKPKGRGAKKKETAGA